MRVSKVETNEFDIQGLRVCDSRVYTQDIQEFDTHKFEVQDTQ